ncbi:MAG: EmrB/QacA family drug resistance transporter [Acidobacteria bacterium]|nr:MAG: EmrB/QacA family drug resistance transporter [Acidobacteriota bacterium]
MANESGHAQPVINPWIIAVAVMLSTFMEVLDTTVVNVSLQHIAGSLSATVDEATWALTSYLVANAIVLPLTGWLSNFFGRKRLLMMAVTGFTIASFFCGLSWNLPALVFFRILQGACGGCLQPISQAVLLESFRPEDRGKAMGFWGLGIVVAPMLGPVLGGWLTDSYTWRWVFYINIPVGVASIIMTKLFLFDPPYIRRSTSKVDYWGIGMLAVGVGALQVVLDRGQEADWFGAHWITALTIISVVGFALFFVQELTTAHPVVRLQVFRERTYATGVFLMTVLGFVLYGSLVILPILLQTLLGYPALQAGIAMAPRGVGSFIAMPLVGIIMSKFDPRKLLGFGILVAALTLFQLSWLNLSAGYWDIFWPQIVQGVSLGFLFVPLTTTTMDPIPKEEMGNATSIFNLMRNIGGSMGIAGATTLIDRRMQAYTNILGADVNPYRPEVLERLRQMQGAFQAGGADAYTSGQKALAATFGGLERQASMLSFNEAFRTLGFLFVLIVPLVLLLRRPRTSASITAGH